MSWELEPRNSPWQILTDSLESASVTVGQTVHNGNVTNWRAREQTTDQRNKHLCADDGADFRGSLTELRSVRAICGLRRAQLREGQKRPVRHCEARWKNFKGGTHPCPLGVDVAAVGAVGA